MRRVVRWAGEFAGVALLAFAGWQVHPALAPFVAGAYLLLLANQGGDDDARTR